MLLVLIGGLALGFAVLVNFLFVVKKLDTHRYVDAFTDIGIMVAASAIYGVSVMGGASATFGSMFISIYLYFYPLTFQKGFMDDMYTDMGTAADRREETPAQSYTSTGPTQESTMYRWADKFDGLFTKDDRGI